MQINQNNGIKSLQGQGPDPQGPGQGLEICP